MDAYLTPSSGVGKFIKARVVSLTPDVVSLPGRVNPVPNQSYRGRRVILKPEPGAALLPGEEVQIHFRSPWTLIRQPKDGLIHYNDNCLRGDLQFQQPSGRSSI